MNQVIVTINEDYDQYSIKGCLGVVLAYDRDKRFLVKVIEGKEVGLHVWLKPHWLDGIDEVVGSYRHMALYKFTSNIDTPETKKERFQYYKERTRKPYKGFQNGMCMFSIKVDDVWFDNLTRKKLISKVRYCLQNNCDFIINVYSHEKFIVNNKGCIVKVKSLDQIKREYQTNMIWAYETFGSCWKNSDIHDDVDSNYFVWLNVTRVAEPDCRARYPNTIPFPKCKIGSTQCKRNEEIASWTTDFMIEFNQICNDVKKKITPEDLDLYKKYGVSYKNILKG